MSTTPSKRERIERGVYFEAGTGLYMARVGSGLPKPDDTVCAWFKTKEAARAWRATSEDDRKHDRPVVAPPHPNKNRAAASTSAPLLFKQFAAEWLEREERRTSIADPSEGRRRGGALRPSTLKSYKEMLRVHLLPRFGEQLMSAITTSAVEEWVTSLAAKGYARQTQITLLRLLRQLFNDAITNNTGGASRNPAYKVGPVTSAHPRLVRARKRARKRILSWVEVRSITSYLPERLRVLVWLQYAMALRTGEAMGVRLRHLTLTPSVVVGADGAEVKVAGTVLVHEQRRVAYTKTHAGNRVVPLPSIVVEYLTGYIEQHHGDNPDPAAYLVPGSGVLRDAAAGADDSGWPRVFYHACERAGLGFTAAGDDGLPWKLLPHFGRSHVNGWLYKVGVDGRTRSDWLGHADDDDDGARAERPAALVTDQAYGDASDPCAMARAAAALDDAIRAELTSLAPPADPRLTADQAAEIAGTTRAGIYKALQDGRLAGVQCVDRVRGRELWRFERDDVEAFAATLGAAVPADDRLSSAEVAAILGIGQVSATRLAKTGVLPAEKLMAPGTQKFVWLFDRAAVLKRAEQVAAGAVLPGFSLVTAARLIGCTRATMYRLLNDGHFPSATKVVGAYLGGREVWRFDLDEVQAIAARWDSTGGGLDGRWGRTST